MAFDVSAVGTDELWPTGHKLPPRESVRWGRKESRPFVAPISTLLCCVSFQQISYSEVLTVIQYEFSITLYVDNVIVRYGNDMES